MAVKDILKWFHSRPWLLLPFLGVVPMAGAYIHQHTPQPQPSLVAAASPTPVSSQSSISPSPLPPPPKVSDPKQASPKPSKSPLVPVDPSKYTKEQAAINARTKAALSASVGSTDGLLEMHVAIAMGVPSSAIGNSNGAKVTDAQGKTLKTLSSGISYSAQSNGDALQLGDQSLPSLVMIEPQGGTLYLGNKAYRGKFLLAGQNGRIWVVNYIDMRQYLYSVVASEVSPTWNKEALKAQAVAARSYAMTYYFKPVNALYHMGADEYYQVYSGIEREDPRTSQAVDETAGEFVSYKGGIVESLYAASDSIVIEAFQGKGMSQLGALKLADQGYNYLQILANYYPKTGISKIEYDHQ
jgi:stage II sporulation protein D